MWTIKQKKAYNINYVVIATFFVHSQHNEGAVRVIPWNGGWPFC